MSSVMGGEVYSLYRKTRPPDIKKALMHSVRGKPFDYLQGAMSSHERNNSNKINFMKCHSTSAG